MGDRLILIIHLVDSAIRDVSDSGLLILVRRSSTPTVRLEQRTFRLHQLCRHKPVRRINEESLWSWAS
jgi:hypothetical protein